MSEALFSGEPTLKRYHLWEPLGEGAMGVVYRAEDRELKRPVAVKILKQGLADNEEVRERFAREARAAARLVHPHLVAIFDVGEESGFRYVVMELVRGKSMRQILGEPSAAGEWPRARRLALLAKVASAVHHCHEQGVVHRDLKPDNILVTEAGEPKITDFGLAHLLDGESNLTRTGAALGTPSYMAPEQAAGRRESIGPRTDVYALGVMLYELLTGRPPFVGATVAQIGAQVLTETPAPPRALNREVPAELEALALKALEKDPALRLATAQELAQEIGRFLEGKPLLTRPPSLVRRAFRGARRRTAMLAAALGVGGVGLAAALWAARRAERAEAVAMIREAARAALTDALRFRQLGARREMFRLLPRLEAAYAGAVARAPRLAEVEYLMGRMHRALMDDRRALGFQERALAKDPDFGPAIYERIVLRSKAFADELQKAQERRGEVLDPKAPELAGLRAGIVEDCARLERLRARDGVTEANVLAARGMVAAYERRFDEATPTLEAALRLDPQMEEAWHALGQAALTRGRLTGAPEKKFEWLRRAEETYTKALEHDRGYAEHLVHRATAKSFRANALLTVERDPVPDWDRAEADYSEFLRAQPEHADALARRGNLRARRGQYRAEHGGDPQSDWEEAAQDLDQAVKLGRANELAWYWRGRLAFFRAARERSQGADPLVNLQRAEEDITRALKLPEAPHDAWSVRGDVYLQRALYRWRVLGADPGPDFDWAESDVRDAFARTTSSITRPRAQRLKGILRAHRAAWDGEQGRDPLPGWAEAERDLSRALEMRREPETLAALEDLRLMRSRHLERLRKEHGGTEERRGDQ